METRIDPKSIAKIQVHHKKPGEWKWYEHKAPVYKKRHPVWEWAIGWLATPGIEHFGQDEGWCKNHGRLAYLCDDARLESWGYEIIEHQGMKMCYHKPYVEVTLSGVKHTVTKRFEDDMGMNEWLEWIQAEAGKRLTLI